MGGLSFVCALLLNILGFILKTLSFLLVNDVTHSLNNNLSSIKNIVRDSYRQFYLAKASQRRQDYLGRTNLIDVANTRAYYLSLNNPLHQSLLRYVLIGSIDHASRFYKSKLLSSPICRIVMLMKKQLSIFFGIVPVGSLFAITIPFFFVFLVLVILNGPNAF